MVARLTTINYEGETQSQGGDPVSALGKLHTPMYNLSAFEIKTAIFIQITTNGSQIGYHKLPTH